MILSGMADAELEKLEQQYQKDLRQQLDEVAKLQE